MQVKKLVLLGAALLLSSMTTAWCYDQPTASYEAQAQHTARNNMKACYKQRADALMNKYGSDKSYWNATLQKTFINSSNSHIINTIGKCYTQCYNVWNVLQSTASITSTQFLAGKGACNACSNNAMGNSSISTYISSFPACQGVP